MRELAIGRGVLRRRGHGIAILAFGSVLKAALQAAEALDASVADMRFVKPLDEALVAELAGSHTHLVTVEENVVQGGAGSAVAESLARMGTEVPMLHLGLPDHFVEHGDPVALLRDCGLDGDGVLRAIRKRYADGGSRP